MQLPRCRLRIGKGPTFRAPPRRTLPRTYDDHLSTEVHLLIKLKIVLSSLDQFIAARVCRGLDDEFCNAQVLVRA
ncbi:hypothetical protein IWQ48_003297 [Labrenzia sp. EL_13]|nr:hypothetical protein [Labrenzia sp. EL_13]